MSHRDRLLGLLERYAPTYPNERDCVARFIGFVRDTPACFERTNIEGHVTGSAFISSMDGQRVLLTHHRKLDAWLQLGGHADGDPDILGVALREAYEESGLDGLSPVGDAIFDLDIHRIPERRSVDDNTGVVRVEPAHLHYDVRFALRAGAGERTTLSDESNALAWVALDELPHYRCDPSILRMACKWRAQQPSR